MEIEVYPTEQIQEQPRALMSRRRELGAGLSGVAPLLLGVVPFGLIYGVLAINAGLPVSMAQGMSLIVFAGSAQFITTQLLHNSAPLLVILLTAVIVNLRHLLYSASLAPYLQALPPGWKALLAYLLTDEAYAVAITRYVGKEEQSRSYAHWYFLGAGLGLWITWQLSTAVGVLLGAQIPAAWSLDFAMPLTFIAIIVPLLKDRATQATALVAGTVACVALTMPLKLGLMTAILVAIGTGYGVEQLLSGERTEDRRQKTEG
ncbi:MAG: AzlC family ABC transporter permease [Caldilineaceae bacterium]